MLGAVGILFLGYVFAVSEWKMRRSYDAPLVSLRPEKPPNLAAGRHMAKIAGCWAGCHGKEGEGGFESIKGIHRSAAPTLSQVLPEYADEELARLIRYGVKRDGKSSIGMIAYATWPLGDQDLADIIAHLRAQPALPPVERSHDFTLRGRWAMVTGKWGVDAAMVNRSLPRWGALSLNTPFERGRYLASVVCAACHGRNLRGSALESTPSLRIAVAYSEEQFRRLLRTATAAGGREVKRMSWVRDVEFTDQEIEDLYVFLREHDGVQIAIGNDSDRPSAVREKHRRA
ncbi:MAG: c-type cytochrome, partial [Candidatus Acidiferrales bacterium]